MTRKAMRILNRCLLVTLTAVALSACIKSDEDLTPCNDPVNGELELRFAATVPTASKPTRALSGAQEDALDKVDVLVFDNNGTKYAYRTYGTVDPESNGNLNRIRVKVLPTGADKHSYVLLGNLRNEIEELFGVGSTISVGDAKEDVLQKITFKAYDNASGTGDAARIARQWNTTTPRYLPMWGDNGQIYTVNTTNDIETINTGTPVKMLRAVARVDVGFGSTPAQKLEIEKKFLPTRIMVYHTNQTGHAVPLASNLVSGQIKADKPTIPTSTAYESILYDLESATISDPYEIERMIYVNEHLNLASPALPNTGRMGIIIGGKYDETGSGVFTSVPQTWYRLDFYHRENINDPQTIIDVLRNHRYRFEITRIEGHGFIDPDEAIKSDPKNMDSNVLIWDQNDMKNIVFDGKNFLSVSDGEFVFTRESRGEYDTDNRLKIRTDIEQGWKATVWNDKAGTVPVSNDPFTNAPWLGISPSSGDGDDTPANNTYLKAAENKGAASRTAYIIIEAGRLNYLVTVTQTINTTLSLSITNPVTGDMVNEMTFVSYVGETPTPQSFKVSWFPLDLNVDIENTQVGNWLFDPSSGVPSTGILPGGTGTKTYDLAPSAITSADLTNDPFAERVSIVRFAITDGISTPSAFVYLRQKALNLAYATKEGYLLNKQSETIFVRSNLSWEITNRADPDGILSDWGNISVGHTGGNNTVVGDALTFTMSPESADLSKTGKQATITLTEIGNPSKTWTITINGAESLYVGRFGGELKKNSQGEWQFEKGLYISALNEVDNPSGVQWSTMQSPTDITNPLDGRANTYALYQLNNSSVTYTAASLCFEKNANYTSINNVNHSNYVWYLPAQGQLMAVWTSLNGLMPDWRPSNNERYWSSTENWSNSAWPLYFRDGSVNSVAKTNTTQVRCVREL